MIIRRTIAMFVLSLATALLGQSSSGSPIRVESMSGETAADGTRYSLLRVSVEHPQVAGGTYKLTVSVRFPGQISTPGEKGLLVNKAGNLGVVTFRPATKTNYSFLLLSKPDEPFAVTDLNKRLVELCRKKKRPINPDYIYVRKVDGEQISISSSVYGKATYLVTVALIGGNKLKLISHKTERK